MVGSAFVTYDKMLINIGINFGRCTTGTCKDFFLIESRPISQLNFNCNAALLGVLNKTFWCIFFQRYKMTSC